MKYDHAIVQVLDSYGLPHLPVVTNMDFGHTDPFWPLPYGCMACIDPAAQTVSLLESGLIEPQQSKIEH
ncbi:MAG TPA: hypothetical protein PLV25_06160 [Opitutales bacterium]|nr:hypothetical protein [Opitutales bacterium]